MRWIVICLLFTNLVYLGWQVLLPASDPHVVRYRGENPAGRQIVMLHEVAEDDRNELKRSIEEPILAASHAMGSVAPAEADRLKQLRNGGCSAIGPFEDVFKAQQVSRQLAALDIGLRVRAVDREEESYDYRLLIPPMNSPEEAFRKLRELQASGIDSYVITAGEYALGISLGVYSSDASVESASARFAEDGLHTEVIRMPRLSRNYWLYHRRGQDLQINAERWKKLSSDHQGVVIAVLPCE